MEHFRVRIEPFGEVALVAHLKRFGLVRRCPWRTASAPRVTAERCTSSIRTGRTEGTAGKGFQLRVSIPTEY
ncbi:ring-cleaving dioxygenase domain protein [Pseudomonas paraeruginosa]|uniref:Ring-cleaving dioxygenase domain protein n=1 Tax=Pseudomonas paraeruginosa TaxID=2994495 RepID=A0A2R3J379_9PSED|nr:ring-cleaving dioxygenase domain protein [Pseudomonas paraeruginosa]AWE93140.1 ring-cleaving dioxygenase domain protein [Pseudomonas paraeruginosa]